MLDYILLLNVLIDDYKYVFLDLLCIRTHQCFQFKITLWSIILGDWVLGHEMYAGWSWIRRIHRLTSSDRKWNFIMFNLLCLSFLLYADKLILFLTQFHETAVKNYSSLECTDAYLQSQHSESWIKGYKKKNLKNQLK